MTRTAELWKKSWLCVLVALAVTLCVAWLAGCNTNNTSQSDQQLKEQAAKTTQQVKQGAQQAAADAKVAAANAERKVDDIAAGVKEGLKSDTKRAGTVDINSASATDLQSLPGVSAARARRIIDNRPYSSPHDLVSKGVVSEAEYSRISGNVVAQ
ncbi:MAG: helix-hairpin-helix domain-containing protein [Silvibacterium sp.]|nr:helix-hairpin-helix domain-containing protein [Silvibacterium sp.]MBV8436431.1 helix-hairpin-helix domain-containing protein [Silvibacterium sp.]